MNMRLLVIGQPDSPHTASFLKRVRERYVNLNIRLYPSSPFPLFQEVAKHCNLCYDHEPKHLVDYQTYWLDMFRKPLSAFSGNPTQLAQIINDFKPDFIHINAVQDGGYLFERAISQGGVSHEAKVNLSVWGNDLHYFKSHPEHRAYISQCLSLIDLIIPESSREIHIATSLGYSGKFCSPIEATLVSYEDLVSYFPDVKPQKENLILIKSAAQSNRSLNGAFLQALYENIELVKGYSLIFINPSLEDYRNLAPLSECSLINIFVAGSLPHQTLCSYLARARFSVSLNLSDGVSNFFLECCASYVLPIVSTSASMEDWNKLGNVEILNPYDIQSCSAQVRALFSHDPAQIAQLTTFNRAALERYREDRVCRIVDSFYC